MKHMGAAVQALMVINLERQLISRVTLRRFRAEAEVAWNAAVA